MVNFDQQPSSQASSEAEFVALLTGAQSNLHAFLTSLLPGERSIDDVLQQTNLVLWQKRADFELGTNFRAWSFSVARWEARAWLTRQKRSEWLSFFDDLSELLASRFEQAAPSGGENAALDTLRHCLGKLKESDRLLVLSHYQHDKSLAECARIFKRGADSLKVSLFRIRQILRRCMDSQLSIERSRS
jgi:RNA polymerase sigma-70 factor (ECF subfamily)